jgi:hypothetical protein
MLPEVVGQRDTIVTIGAGVRFGQASLAGELVEDHRRHEGLRPGERLADRRSDLVTQRAGDVLQHVLRFHVSGDRRSAIAFR